MSDMTNEAKVGDGPLCDQMQALQERARKLHPIDLHDPQLDTADPYARLFLLAEYWQRQAKEARACLDDECDRTDSLLTILGLECYTRTSRWASTHYFHASWFYCIQSEIQQSHPA